MKSYLKWFLSLLFDHLLAVIGAALVFGFLGAWQHWLVTVLCSLICLSLAFVFPYHESWKVGISDYNLHKRTGIEISNLRGIVVGLLAMIPSFLVACFCFLCSVNGWNVGTVFDQSVSELFYRIWFFPYLVLFSRLEQFPVLYFVPVLVTPMMSALGYRLGRRKLMLRDYLYYQREKDPSQ